MVLLLIEGMDRDVNQRLFFHDVERYNQKSVPDARFNMRHEWIFVKYKRIHLFIKYKGNYIICMKLRKK